MNSVKQALIAFFAFAMAMLGTSAHAALDAAVTTAITSGQGDLIALMTALTTAGCAVWVARLIYRHFRLR